MNTEQIKHIQTRVGTEPDGQWGPLSRRALLGYLEDLAPAKRFPTRREIASQTSIFGRHGVQGGYTPPTRKIELPFTIFYEGKPVTHLSPHEKCADAFLGFFQRLELVYPTRDVQFKAGILTYDGLYNPRLMRGSSSTYSMHAWAIAIDLDAGNNLLKQSWPTSASMPLEVIECAVKEGLWSLGGHESRDAMHFEATSGY